MTRLFVLPERPCLGLDEQIRTSRRGYNGVAGLTEQALYYGCANQTARDPRVNFTKEKLRYINIHTRTAEWNPTGMRPKGRPRNRRED
jgi:hypothetical protein